LNESIFALKSKDFYIFLKKSIAKNFNNLRRSWRFAGQGWNPCGVWGRASRF